MSAMNSLCLNSLPTIGKNGVVMQGKVSLLEPCEEISLAKQLIKVEENIWLTMLSSSGLAVLSGLELDADQKRLATELLDPSVDSDAAMTLAKQLRKQDGDRKLLSAAVKKLGPHLPEALRKTVTKELRKSQRLREKFVNANLRLVISVAKRYRYGAMDQADLVQEGTLGLMYAIGRFEPERGLRFSTYACWWIRHAIGRALADKGRAVRVPVYMQDQGNQIAKAKRQLHAELGRTPTIKEVSNRTGISEQKLQEMNTLLVNGGSSMDKKVSATDERTVLDLLPDHRPSAIDAIASKAMSERVHSVFHVLTPIEQKVITLRFGLKDEPESELTFKEIGTQFQLSRERIRQIQNGALRKLKRAILASNAPREQQYC